MKYVVLLLSSILFSCSSGGGMRGNLQHQIETDHNDIEAEIDPQLLFEKSQDSLRKVLLASKPNENLKASLLQELYIRGLVNPKGDNISFKLPFDLHGIDCGAPDCYSTDISFEIPLTKPVEFPDEIEFKIHEYGCVDTETIINSTFRLTENLPDYVNYYSIELKSNLVIRKNGTLYYYPHLKSGSVDLETMERIFQDSDLDTIEIVPYQSTGMTANEYELFITN